MGELLILLALILLNGAFSMSEIALVSARKPRLENDARRGDSRAKAALELASSPNRFLSTVQIGITLIGILTGIYSGENITEDLKVVLRAQPTLAPYANSLSVGIVVVLVTYMTLVFGELLPKRIGMASPEPIAKLVAVPMRLLSRLTAPFIWLLTATIDLLMKVLPIKLDKGTGVTEEEIRAMVQEGKEGGAVEAIEQNIVERVFTLGDRKVSSLMTHRQDLVMFDIHDPLSEVRATFLKDMHSVYPVMDGSPDEVIGVVTLKDLVSHMDEPGFTLRSVLRQPPYLVEGMSAYKALDRFKRSEVRYGLVTDEFGSVEGIITINDILEALVGDVSDFHAAEFTLVERSDGSLLVDGQYPLHELLGRLGEPSLARDVEVNTVGGLFLHMNGSIPQAGDKIEWMRYEIEVVDMDGARIDKVIVKRLAE